MTLLAILRTNSGGVALPPFVPVDGARRFGDTAAGDSTTRLGFAPADSIAARLGSTPASDSTTRVGQGQVAATARRLGKGLQ